MKNSNPLKTKTNYQTKSRGSNSAEYEIYVSCVQSLGWKIKTYDEWINS